MPKLVEKSFASWLATQLTKRVGKTRSRVDCPLANYLRWLGDADVEVETFRRRTAAGRHIPLPLWARDFVHHVDAFGDNEEFLGKHALAILAQRDQLIGRKHKLSELKLAA